MSTLGHHLVLRLQDDRVIAPSPEARRRWARQLGLLAGELPILVWRLADTHLHVLVLGERSTAEELIRRLRIWVTRALRPGVPLEVQRTKPLAGQSHLEATFHYILRQDAHHGVGTDPLHEASALPDIMSLRRTCPALPTRVREHLPRMTREQLLKHFSLDSLGEELHPELLAEAARGAFGLDALGRDEASVRARRAAVWAGRELGAARVAGLVGVTRACAWQSLKGEIPAADVRAVRLQMALRAKRRADVAVETAES